MVKGRNLEQPQTWELQVENDIHHRRDDGRKAHDVEPTARRAIGHAMTSHQRTGQRQPTKHRHASRRWMHGRHQNAGGRHIDHGMQRGEQSLGGIRMHVLHARHRDDLVQISPCNCTDRASASCAAATSGNLRYAVSRAARYCRKHSRSVGCASAGNRSSCT